MPRPDNPFAGNRATSQRPRAAAPTPTTPRPRKKESAGFLPAAFLNTLTNFGDVFVRAASTLPTVAFSKNPSAKISEAKKFASEPLKLNEQNLPAGATLPETIIKETEKITGRKMNPVLKVGVYAAAIGGDPQNIAMGKAITPSAKTIADIFLGTTKKTLTAKPLPAGTTYKTGQTVEVLGKTIPETRQSFGSVERILDNAIPQLKNSKSAFGVPATFKGKIIPQILTGRIDDIAQQLDATYPKQFVGDYFRKLTSGKRLSIDELSGLAKQATEVPRDFVKSARLAQRTIKPELPDTLPAPARDSVQRLVEALKNAKSVRGKQEALYTQARGEKMAKILEIRKKNLGVEGYKKELALLKGELPKVDFENIAKNFNQKDFDGFFRAIVTNPHLDEWEKLPAQRGLAKIFGFVGKEKAKGGYLPTQGELEKLKVVFGNDFVQTILEKRTLLQHARYVSEQLLNIPRSVMASLDLSAPFRQGIFMVNRRQFWKAFPDMFKSFGSEHAFKEVERSIRTKRTFDLMRRSNLSVTDIGSELATREEAFMSNWAEKIPGIGKIVRASSRAYTAFLNKLRADVFDDLVIKNNLFDKPDELAGLARFINAATGRGSLGELERAAVALNSVFFSPRLIASRVNLLSPRFYMRLPPVARREALKSMFSLAATGLAVTGLAKMGGASVEADPRSADFGKIRVGNTRYDIFGGFQQYLTLFARMITNESKSSTTGKEFKLGEKYGSPTRFDVAIRFLQNKLAPVPSFIATLLKGKDIAGLPVDAQKEITNRFVPLLLQDMSKAYEEWGSQGVVMSLPATFGIGVQTYNDQPTGIGGKTNSTPAGPRKENPFKK